MGHVFVFHLFVCHFVRVSCVRVLVCHILVSHVFVCHLFVCHGRDCHLAVTDSKEVCNSKCKNGKCNKAGICECKPGYYGTQCTLGTYCVAHLIFAEFFGCVSIDLVGCILERSCAPTLTRKHGRLLRTACTQAIKYDTGMDN